MILNFIEKEIYIIYEHKLYIWLDYLLNKVK